jgi:multidrug efflux system outer membrane protein
MRRLIATAGALALLSGCSMAPRYIRPAAPVPQSWPAGDAYLKQAEAALPTVSYRDIFRDPRLQALIEQALANNRDLRITAANIVSAREQYRIQRAQLLPTIVAGADATFTGGPRADASGTGSTTSRDKSSYAADIGVSGFEIDLFGRIRSLGDAARNRYLATEAAARATRLTLVSDVANAWLSYAADKSLLDIAERTAKNAGRGVELTQARLKGGIAPRVDLRQAELILNTATADLAEQRTTLAQDVNALQLLVGAPIDPALLAASIEEVDGTMAELPAGLDSSILLRRPDVVEAEYQLRAANAEIGAARAALFPRIALTALAGFASGGLSSLFDHGNFAWSAAPSAQYPIFSGGAGRAGVRQSKAGRDAALASYEKAIQTAFRDVADALARRGTISDQMRANLGSVNAAEDNYRLSDARYREGIDNFLQSLDAQRSLYTAQRTLVGTRLLKGSNLVALYTALGGDALYEPSAQ